jgi:hypothetical protein
MDVCHPPCCPFEQTRESYVLLLCGLAEVRGVSFSSYHEKRLVSFGSYHGKKTNPVNKTNNVDTFNSPWGPHFLLVAHTTQVVVTMLWAPVFRSLKGSGPRFSPSPPQNICRVWDVSRSCRGFSTAKNANLADLPVDINHHVAGPRAFAYNRDCFAPEFITLACRTTLKARLFSEQFEKF